MEIEGKVIHDLGTQTGTSKAGNPWAKKEVIIETFGTFPKKVKLTIFGEQRMNNTPAEIGNSYAFNIEIESREYMGRWYTDVNAFSSHPLNSETPPTEQNPFGGMPAQPVPSADNFVTPASDPFGSSESDDLPF